MNETQSETVCTPSEAVQMTKEITDSVVGLIGMFLIGYFVQQIINLIVNRNAQKKDTKNQRR